jgi:hypothetical protein
MIPVPNGFVRRVMSTGTISPQTPHSAAAQVYSQCLQTK